MLAIAVPEMAPSVAVITMPFVTAVGAVKTPVAALIDPPLVVQMGVMGTLLLCWSKPAAVKVKTVPATTGAALGVITIEFNDSATMLAIAVPEMVPSVAVITMPFVTMIGAVKTPVAASIDPPFVVQVGVMETTLLYTSVPVALNVVVAAAVTVMKFGATVMVVNAPAVSAMLAVPLTVPLTISNVPRPICVPAVHVPVICPLLSVKSQLLNVPSSVGEITPLKFTSGITAPVSSTTVAVMRAVAALWAMSVFGSTSTVIVCSVPALNNRRGG